MIEKYKWISIAKISDGTTPGGKQPTHALKVKGSNLNSKPLTVGKFWLKTGNYGNYLAGTMSNSFKGDNGILPGYVIVNESDLDKLIETVSLKARSPLGTDYPVEGDDGVPDPQDIDF